MPGKHALHADSLTVESFVPVHQPGGCVCDVAPCICTRAPDCTAALGRLHPPREIARPIPRHLEKP